MCAFALLSYRRLDIWGVWSKLLEENFTLLITVPLIVISMRACLADGALQCAGWVVRFAGAGRCYLTDVGADARLPEALAAELHRHLSTHRVLLTDLLKCLLPNNHAVNY